MKKLKRLNKAEVLAKAFKIYIVATITLFIVGFGTVYLMEGKTMLKVRIEQAVKGESMIEAFNNEMVNAK